MKKILIIFALFVAALMPAFSVEDGEVIKIQEGVKHQKRINEIGYKLLNCNKVKHRVVFYYDSSKTVNAAAYYSNNRIKVYKGLLNYIDSDDELAFILGHEISHAIDYRSGVLRGTFSGIAHSFYPKKYEMKADKRAVDFMVKAGYNPVAGIVILNKINTQNRFEFFISTYPLGSRRLMYIYSYIFDKYPDFLVDNKYKDNVYYQNFLLTSMENREKFKKAVKGNSYKKPKYY